MATGTKHQAAEKARPAGDQKLAQLAQHQTTERIGLATALRKKTAKLAKHQKAERVRLAAHQKKEKNRVDAICP